MNMTEKRKRISPLQALKSAQKSVEMTIGDNFEVISINEKISRKDKKLGIAWEKWKDPYGDNWQDEEWPGALSPQGVNTEFTSENIDDDDFPIEIGRRVRMMPTPLGMIPLTEESNPSKVFNFWTGYTNFKITKKIIAIIDDVEGVETQTYFTRYRFRVGIGKLFKDREVLDCINHRVAAYLKHLETSPPCQIKLSGEIYRKKAN